jgi:hypothetical protein
MQFVNKGYNCGFWKGYRGTGIIRILDIKTGPINNGGKFTM